MKWTDPLLGPVLSALIYFLMFALGFLVVTLPFAPNAGVAGGAIGVLASLLGVVIQARGRVAEKVNGLAEKDRKS